MSSVRTSKTGTVKLLWKTMGANRRIYIGALFAVAFATLFSYAVPLVVRITIDSAIGDQPIALPPFAAQFLSRSVGLDFIRTNLWVIAAVVVSMTVIGGSFLFLQQRLSAQAAERTAQSIRERLYDHLQHLSYQYHVTAETGDLIQRSTSDVDTVRRFLAVQLVEVGRGVLMVGTAFPLLLSIYAPLALLSIPVIVVIFLFSLIFFRKVKHAFKQSDEAEGRLSTVLQENLTGVRVVRAFARQAYEMDKFEHRNREYRDLTMRLIRLLATYWSVSDFMAMFQMGLVLCGGTIFALRGALSIGDLVVFITVNGMLLWPVRALGRILADMGKAVVSITRIQEVLDEPTEYPPEPGLKPEIRGAIEFRDVHFEYSTEREILRGVSFVAEPGTTVAILGPTGSGKSTLVHLLARLYDYTAGEILIDGVPLKQIDKKWIRSHIGFVLQEPFLFAKTIKENIGLARRSVSEPAVFEAARDAAVHDVIQGFQHGYETLVGERGVTLSGGQKQRVAIARALITDNPIMVFDDSLSAVDTETDVAIRRALLRRSGSATTFIISHRVTTLASADLILVLDDGRIVESGTHAQLMQSGGLYQRVWAIQNSLEDEMNKELSREHV